MVYKMAYSRSKDLAKDNSIHDDFVQRKLLEKCSHTPVIMDMKCDKFERLIGMHKRCNNVISWTPLRVYGCRVCPDDGECNFVTACLDEGNHCGLIVVYDGPILEAKKS